MREVVAITGDPGAGKSTLARALAEALGASVWSAGDAARALSREVQRGVAWGPEEEMRALMRRAVEAATGPLILDGWPRRPGQAQALLEAAGDRWTMTLILRAPAELVLARYRAKGQRMRCPECGWRGDARRCPLCESLTEDIAHWYTKRRAAQAEELEAALEEVSEMAKRGMNPVLAELKVRSGLSWERLGREAGVGTLTLISRPRHLARTLLRVAEALERAGVDPGPLSEEEARTARLLYLMARAEAETQEG